MVHMALPVTLLPQITNRQNGEFEATHSRKGYASSAIAVSYAGMPEYGNNVNRVRCGSAAR